MSYSNLNEFSIDLFQKNGADDEPRKKSKPAMTQYPTAKSVQKLVRRLADDRLIPHKSMPFPPFLNCFRFGAHPVLSHVLLFSTSAFCATVIV